ncbi:MAG: hypothetical protein JWO31_1805 [Phycisphaerales bacterium]|nr:hypothetical protein [Phycisphaerales bacterium]
MKTLLVALLLASLASAGCARNTDPERDFGSFSTGDYVRVKRSTRGTAPAAVDALTGTLRSSDKPGCVWDAYLTNTDKARAVRATVVKSDTPNGDGPPYAVDVPAGRGVPLGCAHPAGDGKDAFFRVVDGTFSN